ncbi:MAG TPA: zf-HC2 domain-containing protein [Thermoanaerobacterales bacterium]|nr:zf-HC2 domain-containing protein [Thermoanaerobacterales bacterium]
MIKISCDVCLDLIPLVKDNVASKDSINLVKEHISECKSCRIQFDGEIETLPEMDDKQVLLKIRNRIFIMAISAIIIGALIGIGLTEGPGLFYNILIMPLIGAIAYFTLNGRSYYFPIGLFILSYFWILIKYTFDGTFTNAGILSVFIAPIFWSLIYAGLSLLGIIIAFLLKFAFRKESDYEENS